MLVLAEFVELYKRKQWREAVASNAAEDASRLSGAGSESIELGAHLLAADGDRAAALELAESGRELLHLLSELMEEARSKRH